MARLKGGWHRQSLGHSIAKTKGRWGGAKRHNLMLNVNTTEATPPSPPASVSTKPSNWLDRFKEKQREREAKKNLERETKRKAEMEATKQEILKLQLEHEKAIEKMQSEKQLAELKHERDVLSGAEARRETRKKYLKLVGGLLLKEAKYALKGARATHKHRRKRKKK